MRPSRDPGSAGADHEARAQGLRAILRDTLARLDPAARTGAALGELAWRARATVIVAAGKAAPAMAAGALRFLDSRGLSARGVVIGVDTPALARGVDARLRAWPGSHPVPDERSLRAARAACAAVAGGDPAGVGRDPGDAGILALISGGASALMALPAAGLTLADKVATLRAVAASGADIRDLNIARKHLSAIKGGQLAARAAAAVTTLVASDVVGDDLATVGSGPTVPDPSTFEQACGVVARAGWDAVPAAARHHLEEGRAGRRPETPAVPRPGDRAVLVAGTGALIDAAAGACRASGAAARVFARDLTGDVGDVARRVAGHARSAAGAGDPVCLVGGGEATIALPPGAGTGGRAQHIALLVARELAAMRRNAGDLRNLAVLVAGSDGIDGNSPAAGAVVDGRTWDAIRAAGVDPEDALRRCDSFPALHAAGATVITGPTGVNHADLVVIAAGGRARC